MSTHQARFATEHQSITEALAPWVIEIDGQQFISPDAPTTLTDAYSRMTSLGIYKGWL